MQKYKKVMKNEYNNIADRGPRRQVTEVALRKQKKKKKRN